MLFLPQAPSEVPVAKLSTYIGKWSENNLTDAKMVKQNKLVLPVATVICSNGSSVGCSGLVAPWVTRIQENSGSGCPSNSGHSSLQELPVAIWTAAATSPVQEFHS